MRYRLRTLLIALALGPMVLAGTMFLVAWAWYIIQMASIPQGIKGLE